jgi:hypothetical protein
LLPWWWGLTLWHSWLHVHCSAINDLFLGEDNIDWVPSVEGDKAKAAVLAILVHDDSINDVAVP